MQVTKASERTLGEKHPSTLSAKANLALTYTNQGRWKEAEQLEVQVLEASERSLGEGHPSTLTTKANLGRPKRLIRCSFLDFQLTDSRRDRPSSWLGPHSLPHTAFLEVLNATSDGLVEPSVKMGPFTCQC